MVRRSSVVGRLHQVGVRAAMEHILLQYNELAPGKHRAAFERVCQALRAGDFRAAQAKKLSPGPYYRAELSATDRLLFTFGSAAGQTCILLLEIIENHAYDQSRFLRGAAVDEAKLVPLARPPERAEEERFAFVRLHQRHGRFHLLDKVLSFDDEQEAALHGQTPLVLIGSAGSGKTALLIERLKQFPGEVAYITRSPFLAEHAAKLYHAHDYEQAGQVVDFLSFKEYLESIRVPEGRLVTERQFAGWFARYKPSLPVKDAHLVYEEFIGVITGVQTDRPWLSREDYLALGVRRSIFLNDQREVIYSLFEKYRSWLQEEKLYDLNIASFHALPLVTSVYDAVVLDEVQDLTNVQVRLALSALKDPRQFVLSGDANQLVHPNFFSWSALKTMFMEQHLGGGGPVTRLLCANYRNAPAITALANRLLRLKNARFGSVDKESTMLARSVSGDSGTVQAFGAAAARELDGKTHQSVRVAVIVLREEDKVAARQLFRTPLLFSVQEAKGLEYETVIAYGLVGAAERIYRDIADGVSVSDLAEDADLTFARGRDKADKSLEALKFYVNALYVTVTRAVRSLYWVETRLDHPLLELLQLRAEGHPAARLAEQKSSAEEWQREARKLEMQGREEQAEAIRQSVLGQQPVPWPVLMAETLPELDRQAFNPDHFNKQAKNAVFEYAVVYSDKTRLRRLSELGYHRADHAEGEEMAVMNRLQMDYTDPRFGALRVKLQKYGLNFRNTVNQTPLMLAVQRGCNDLVRELIQSGANPDLRDGFGRTAFHISLRTSFRQVGYIERHLSVLWEWLAPESVNVKTDGRLHKLDRHRMDFFVFQAMIAMLQDLLRSKIEYDVPGLQTGDILAAVQRLPPHVVPLHRQKREVITNVLAGHELFKDELRNKRLFLRLSRGHYVFNPELEVEVEDRWVNVYDFIGLDHMADSEDNERLKYLRDYLKSTMVRYRAWREAQAAAQPGPSVAQSPG